MFDFESTHLDETGSESVGSGNLKDYGFDVIVELNRTTELVLVMSG